MENLLKRIRSVSGYSLTDAERVQMRASLITYMHAHPVQRVSGIRSPLTVLAVTDFFERSNTYIRILVPSTLALVVVVVGTSSLAGRALPGDALYALKVQVSEPVSLLFATSPEQVALLQVQHASERLDEAEALAQLGRLNDSTHSIIQARLSQNIHSVSASVQALTAAGNVSAADHISTILEDSLSSHFATLLNSPVPTSSEPTVALVAATVRDEWQSSTSHHRGHSTAQSDTTSSSPSDSVVSSTTDTVPTNAPETLSTTTRSALWVSPLSNHAKGKQRANEQQRTSSGDVRAASSAPASSDSTTATTLIATSTPPVTILTPQAERIYSLLNEEGNDNHSHRGSRHDSPTTRTSAATSSPDTQLNPNENVNTDDAHPALNNDNHDERD